MKFRSLVLGAVLVAIAPATAWAQEASSSTEGTVIAIDGDDLVVDIGSVRGGREGDVVELWRPVRLKHPVTGKLLTDHFRIGAVRLTQVQGTLSLAKKDGAFLRAPAVGDQLVVARAPDKVLPPPPPKDQGGAKPPAPAAPAPPAPADPDAQMVVKMFEDLRGATPADRIVAYKAFVRARPSSRFAAVLLEEAVALRAHDRAEDQEPVVHAAHLHRVHPGAPQRFAVELDDRFVGAVIHVRAKGSTAYRSVPMASIGPRYWSAPLPGDAVAPPAMEYFVEGVLKTGTSIAVVGNGSSPKESAVDPTPVSGKQSGTLAQIGIATEYASFNTKKANDYLFQTEGTFGWRLRDVGIRAVRSGFGVLRGKGGRLADLDTLNQPPTSVGLTYGWVEGEFAPTADIALIGRPIIGLRDEGVAGGAQGFIRLGSDLKTNLLIGGEVLGTVGLRGIVELDWRTVPRVPIVLRSEVTNQPAGVGTDVGARAIAQVGYELTRELTVAARGSYQGRTINHAGPGAGLGVNYQW